MFFDFFELIKDLSEDERKRLQPVIEFQEGWEEAEREFWFVFLIVVLILTIIFSL
jgi:hypothetical protein